MAALPVIILFDILLLAALVFDIDFKVSTELVLNNDASKKAAIHYLLCFLIPSGLLAFIAAYCVQKKKLTKRYLSVLVVSSLLVFTSAVATLSTLPIGEYLDRIN